MSKPPIDSNTGLPALPDGYHFEVGYVRYDNGFTVYSEFVVGLYKTERKKRNRLAALFLGAEYDAVTVREQVVVEENNRTTAKDTVFNAAVEAWEREKRIIERENLIGKYPPNRL